MTHTFRDRLLIPLLFCAALPLSVGVARADIQQTFNFSGTLATPINGGTSVTGQFTIDFTKALVTAFDFSSPVGNIEPPQWGNPVVQEISATNPSATFTRLYFEGPGPLDAFDLFFESPLSTFSGGSLYTGGVTFGHGGDSSSILCESRFDGCGGIWGSSGFSSGSATPVTSAVPEPTSIALLGGVLLFTGIRLRKRPLSK